MRLNFINNTIDVYTMRPQFKIVKDYLLDAGITPDMYLIFVVNDTVEVEFEKSEIISYIIQDYVKTPYFKLFRVKRKFTAVNKNKYSCIFDFKDN